MSKSLLYLSKIFTGLSLFAAFLLIPVVASQMSFGFGERSLLAVLPVLGMSLIYPVVRYFHQRADELQQQIHLRACLFAVCSGTSTLAMLGILQELDFIAGLSFLHAPVILLACWGLGLMLADRGHH
ncbi:hypothetical protein ACO0LC_23905 [Undibacterium sp. JH2W]|uniref:hypothetical protein n=1 Tax=Undibacterium sp. JH2W TaxID=3413037 RepID=UPI003BF3391F